MAAKSTSDLSNQLEDLIFRLHEVTDEFNALLGGNTPQRLHSALLSAGMREVQAGTYSGALSSFNRTSQDLLVQARHQLAEAMQVIGNAATRATRGRPSLDLPQ